MSEKLAEANLASTVGTTGHSNRLIMTVLLGNQVPQKSMKVKPFKACPKSE
jgi:hypothetical protein